VFILELGSFAPDLRAFESAIATLWRFMRSGPNFLSVLDSTLGGLLLTSLNADSIAGFLLLGIFYNGI